MSLKTLQMYCQLIFQESYPLTPPIWFVDSDDPSLTQVLERLEDVRKGSTVVSAKFTIFLQFPCSVFDL